MIGINLSCVYIIKKVYKYRGGLSPFRVLQILNFAQERTNCNRSSENRV